MRVFTVFRIIVTTIVLARVVFFYSMMEKDIRVHQFDTIVSRYQQREGDPENWPRLHDHLQSTWLLRLMFGSLGQQYNLFYFILGLAYSALNIFITSLLYAGSFANKRNCLPIYAYTEPLLDIHLFRKLLRF
ncbi:hypothetical protein PMAYCL1PPCAC_05642 [Pristionchus mayeri]|uniref:Uncharacterized protein n=1 Tax=Pristionchus mayeri TaxID=1317129 RepID=A0AAN5CA40_9BILA|nr:hypothetical protein PMAYCL1PPCAC_05642 [Pristionchus mayeri]